MAADSVSMRKVGSALASKVLHLRASRLAGGWRFSASTNSHPKASARSLPTVFLPNSAAPVMIKTMLLIPLLRRRSIPKNLFFAEQESCNCQGKRNDHHPTNNRRYPLADHR